MEQQPSNSPLLKVTPIAETLPNTTIGKKRNLSPSSPSASHPISSKPKSLLKKREKQKQKKKQKWYTPKINSNIYLSNLPLDITIKELITFTSKCGFIRNDPLTGIPKVKIYHNKQTNTPNGDALVSYLRSESVDLALAILNDTEIRPNHVVKVERATFVQKGAEYIPRQSNEVDKLLRFKNKTEIDRMLGWNEEEDEKGLKIVVFENMFEPSEFDIDVGLRNDIDCDIVEECERVCGKIIKWKIYDNNPNGIVKIKFKTAKAAEDCVVMFNGREYNGRVVKVFYWDGKTDYDKVKETEGEMKKRIEEFGEWLENE